ncbi:hypothetical protein B0T26DRAFT_671558 [Lasiosphaeria miniovina]|uniref:Aminoglycoside phosphotransferase domain-containing protein n=1 Tax=Lasiosphaeria miniovina TaxID=1954250 RepID=A0AA40B340_9PEZI|nr:uncharacterized protein B0T26DRAFT_671558 [Lasiosphaeria miniovina]KAK0726807.1 hypothetical protein B0T26DRAFT_671558 [Lasiosphaeria miniovina]
MDFTGVVPQDSGADIKRRILEFTASATSSLRQSPEHQVLTLASSYRNAAPCDFFDKLKHGSYNICYFVQFPDGVKWVVPYAASDSPEPLSSFLILEFVKGQKLDLSKLKNLPERQQANLYTSLADIYSISSRPRRSPSSLRSSHQDVDSRITIPP